MRSLGRLATLLMLVAVSARAEDMSLEHAPGLARIVVDGMINPAVTGFIHESLGRAERDHASALVIQLDTPGGLLPSTRAIVKDILNAKVPVIVYVAPSGAGAGSAGVFITMSAHVAAMAPGTSIGAAHPVGGQGEDIKGTLGTKIENFTASFSESIAKQRGRNVEWAIRAVRESVSIAADEAAKTKVVDFVAKDLEDVVAQANGRAIELAGEKHTLAFGKELRDEAGGLRVHDYEMSLAQKLLNVLADPNIAVLLMGLGMLGLYVEFTHPGVFLPGVAGAICLLLGFAALHVLPVNTSGLFLMLLGIALLVAEAFLPTFGVVGAGGILAFVLGALFLFDTAETGIAVSRSLIAGTAIALTSISLAIALLVVRTRQQRTTLGAEGLVGEIAEARSRLAPKGTVLVRGEYWTAVADGVVEAGESVVVTGMDGLQLRVRRMT